VQLRAYAEVTPLAEKLIEKFLPGKLTIVLNVKGLPDELTAGTGTVGIRIPNHPKVLEVIREMGKPITATSANVSGMPTGKTPGEILAQFGDKASWITKTIDQGELPPSEPSTVVDARGENPIILREGAISEKDILTI
jgi:L-threonylcarbamoyladenylate synthase